MSNSSENPSELIIGLVAPVGVDINSFINRLRDYIKQCRYEFNQIRLSSLIKTVNGLATVIKDKPEYDRIDSLMGAGNEVRNKSGRNDIVAALGVCSVSKKRSGAPLYSNAHIFDSLKHPDEVKTLRDIYGEGFYLLGISSSRSNRFKYLKGFKGMTQEQATKLINRDESEEFEYGQHMRDAFYLANGFINIDADDSNDQIARIIDLIFSTPYSTPTRDEYAMFLAFAASLRSADLSRQVGAVITSSENEIIATGANDVPCPNGGLYWANDSKDQRDFILGYDANAKKRDEITIKIMKKLANSGKTEEELLKEGKTKLRDTGVYEITEYGRSVHAEMEALICCARSGVSPRGGTLYCTTFPCHNCAKHIVAAGISRVVFIEPYPKSKAPELHPDSIFLAHEEDAAQANSKVKFEPFVGVGPRRFIDLFSMNLSSGSIICREINGKKVDWERSTSHIRVPLKPISYIESETNLAVAIDNWIGEEK